MQYALRTVVSLLPWIASMYLFYWLDATDIWTPETPHRGKLSVLLLGSGMLATFFLYTTITRKKR